jgi:hypothetical protein
MQTSERWQNVRMSDAEVAMLKQLRRGLGLCRQPLSNSQKCSVRRFEPCHANLLLQK